MTFSERLQEIRTGFERPFWVANITEIFERLSYYGAFASLALYLQEKLNFSTEQTGTLTGIFGGMVWFLAIFGGAAADRLGFNSLFNPCSRIFPHRFHRSIVAGSRP